MNLICFDTCGMKGCVTLVKHNVIVGNLVLSKVFGHNETLLPSIDMLLNNSNLSIKDITGVGYVRGPGSFTGLRIGAAVAYGLTSANSNLNLYGFSSLYLLNRGLLEKGHKYSLTLIDARKKQVYLGCFKNGKEMAPYTAIAPDEIKQFLISNGIEDFSFAIGGTGIDKYEEQLKNIFCESEFVQMESCFSKYLAMEIINPLGFEESSEEPLYIRKSDAELNKNRKNK